MDNENKELQNSPSEAELEEKVRQDVSEKIASAAAELEEEIAEADAVAEETEAEEEVDEAEDKEPVIVDYDEEGNPIFGEEEEDPGIVGYDEEGNPIYAEEEEEVKEPKWVSLKLRNLILSLVGAALIGALLLFLGVKAPAWSENAGSSVVPATPLFQDGKTAIKVAGEVVTDKEMEVYIYHAAMDYIEQNGGVVTDPLEFDWSTEVEDGKTAEDVVKENAVKTAVESVLLMKAGNDAGVEWDDGQERALLNASIYQQYEKEYGKDLTELLFQASGYRDMEQFIRLTLRDRYKTAILDDMTANPDSYYPDAETMAEFAATDGATVKHILIAYPQEAAAEGEEAAAEGEEAPVDKKLLAEEILKKIQEGGDFDALVEEFNEDPGQPAEGYTFGPGEMVPEFEKAAFALGLNEISGIVETAHGYHIIKRIPGEMDLVNYWMSTAKVVTKQKVLDSISLADIIGRITTDRASCEALMMEHQANNSGAVAK